MNRYKIDYTITTPTNEYNDHLIVHTTLTEEEIKINTIKYLKKHKENVVSVKITNLILIPNIN